MRLAGQDWRPRLHLAVSMAASQRAYDLLLGRTVSPSFDRARDRLLDVIADVERAGVSRVEIDAELASVAKERA